MNLIEKAFEAVWPEYEGRIDKQIARELWMLGAEYILGRYEQARKSASTPPDTEL